MKKILAFLLKTKKKDISMKHLTTFLGLVFIAVIAYFLWVTGKFFISIFTAANPDTAVGILGAMTTVLVGLAAVIITQRQTKLREIEEAHRAKKVDMYEKYVKLIGSAIAIDNKNITTKHPSQQTLINGLASYHEKLILWGSPDVVKTQLEFRQASNEANKMLPAVDNMYKAIRKDIGLSNRGLNNLELVKMYLKDPDELDKQMAGH